MVLKIGHRGSCGYEPENTIISFKKAIELGVDFVEMDVHISKDNKLIVIHDSNLDKTTNGKGKISKKTLEEIKNYRTIKKNQQIPTLQEVINELKGKTKFNIEIKGIRPAREVAKTIKKNRIEKEVIVASNYPKSLLIVKNIIPNVKTSLEYYSTKTRFREYLFVLFSLLIFPITKRMILKRAKLAKVNYIHLVYPFATKKFIAELHSQGYKIIVWVVNNTNSIKKMIDRKVDGIITDYPDRLNF